MSDRRLQAESRARIRVERNGDPSWAAIGDGLFALHIQYGGNAVVVNVGKGSEDQAAFREWLGFHWPAESQGCRHGRVVGTWCPGCPGDTAAPGPPAESQGPDGGRTE